MPEPGDWKEDRYVEDHVITGFSAGVYKNGSEIVISFTGTNQSQFADFDLANFPAGMGIGSLQITQAAMLVIDTLRDNPGATVSFTGHSLGGGLASVMAVLFDRPAKVFDAAPFEASVRNTSTLGYLTVTLALLGYTDPMLALYTLGQGIEFARRERNVEAWFVKGEVLEMLRLPGTTIVDAERDHPLKIGPTSLTSSFDGKVNLHSITLLNALLISEPFAEAVRANPLALETFFDQQLYARDPQVSPTADFLTLMAIRQVGNPENGIAPVASLDALGADIARIQLLGTSGIDAMNRGLLVALTEHHYHSESPSPLLGMEGSAVHFNLGALHPHRLLSRATPVLVDGLKALTPAAHDKLAKAVHLDHWHIQSGAGAMVWTDTAGVEDVAVGGSDGDHLNGGSRDDILIGLGGDDTLEGGTGANLLIGGAHSDTYIVGTGVDTIYDDADGEGRIVTTNGAILVGGRAAGRPNTWVGANGEVYSFVATTSENVGTLTINKLGTGGFAQIEEFQLDAAQRYGYLGISLETRQRVVVNEAGNGNPFMSFYYAAGVSSGLTEVTEGSAKSYTVYLSVAAHAGDTLKFALNGSAGLFQIVREGGSAIPSDGVVTLAEGQTEVGFRLLQDTAVSTDATATLAVEFFTQDGTVSASSPTLSIALGDVSEPEAVRTGDQAVATYVATSDLYRGGELVVAKGQDAYRIGSDGNLVTGVGPTLVDNVLYGSNQGDRMEGLTGHDAANGGPGDDELDGGEGDDLLAGGAGNNTIVGGAGNDFILAAGHLYGTLQQIGPNDLWQAPTGKTLYGRGSTWGVYQDSEEVTGEFTVWDGAADALSPSDGSAPGANVIDAGDGDDRVIGGPGTDRIDGGSGRDILDGGIGNDVIEGGDGADHIEADGIVRPGYLNTTMPEAHGADFVDGGAGDDEMQGGGSHDHLYGGDDNDRIWGDSGGLTNGSNFVGLSLHGNDYLDGENGNDYLEGGGGDDVIYGGLGDDRLWGDLPAENVVGNDSGQTAAELAALASGADVLDGEDGNDIAVGGGGDDRVYGGDGDDLLWGDFAREGVFVTQHGNDVVSGGNGNDQLVGEGGDDILLGGAGNDTIDGGTGSDAMFGGPGDDKYFVDSFGDTIDEQADEGKDTVFSTITFALPDNVEDAALTGDAPAGITGNDGANQLFGNAAANRLSGLDGNDYLIGGAGGDEMAGGPGNDVYEVENAADVVVELPGEGIDVVYASVAWTPPENVEQVVANGQGDLPLYGNGRDNTLVGNGANNVLTGGGGNDFLRAGEGNDLYVFQRGDGRDLVDNFDYGGALDRLSFGADIKPADVVASRLGNDLILRVLGDGNDQVVVRDYFVPDVLVNGLPMDHRVDEIVFGDGTRWGPTAVQDAVNRTAANHAPTAATIVPAITGRAGFALEYAVPAGAFADADVGDTLTYSLRRPDGSAAPGWLHYDRASRAFSGVPDAESVGVTEIVLWATDRFGVSVGQAVNLVIAEAERAPTLTTPLPDQTTATGAPFSWSLPADAFIDPDAGDALTFEVAQADGSPLPSWLRFDPVSRTFIGTPATTGTTHITVTATDPFGLSATDSFDIVVREGLDLVGTAGADRLEGSKGNDTLAGLAGDDTLLGGNGNDTLDGGSGADLLQGGAGDDTYFVDNAGDSVIESVGEGRDTVQASIATSLAANVEDLTLTGSAAINGTGNALDNTLTGNAGANTLTGGDGNDRLDGMGGADRLVGGAGDDRYVVDNTGDVVVERHRDGTDTIDAAIDWSLPNNVENLVLTGSAVTGTGNSLDNLIIGNATANTLDGANGTDTLQGGGGDDTYIVDDASDRIVELAGEGADTVLADFNTTLPDHVEYLVFTGKGSDDGTGNSLDNLLRGNAGANVLDGAAGIDILEGAAGNDTLIDTSGAGLFNGGAGTDILNGGAGAQIYVGGTGNDTITTGSGNDVILFNRGDGQDTVAAGDSGVDTLSLGGGLRYADLSFAKSANDLVLNVGGTERITFKDWYAITPTRSVVNLQVIAEAMTDFSLDGTDPLRDDKIENFSFTGLVGAFDAARAGNPALSTWALGNALASFQTGGSDTAAIGGDLAYQYGSKGTLAGIGVTPALAVLGDPTFGSSAQTLAALSALQVGTVRLS